MTDEHISRVRYYDQQILRTSDFVDEQAYHLAQRRRHTIGGHIWGIVYGLELAEDANGDLTVQPGMAIDGYGRELILSAYRSIPASIFSDRGGDTLDVFLEYAQQASDETPSGWSVCRPGDGGNRLQETVRLTIRKAGPPRGTGEIDLPERRAPEEVPADERRFSPARVSPDSPARRWPVFLGQLHRGADPVVSLSGRPYAGLRGEMVRASSGWAWLQIGEWPANDYRFAVFLADGVTPDEGAAANRAPLPTLGIKPAPAPPTEPAAEGEAALPAAPAGPTLELRAETTLWGDLIVEGGAIEFGAGPPYDGPRPWRIYHVDYDASGDELRDAEAIVRDELRIEMADGSEGASEVVIGHWSEEQGDFQPCLTIAAGGDVTVHGDLTINGELLRFEQAEATDEALVRFVVRRTRTVEGQDQPAWFGALLEALAKRDLLAERFLPFVVAEAGQLGLGEGIIGKLLESAGGEPFARALAQAGPADFVERYLGLLADLAQGGEPEAVERLATALDLLARTVSRPALSPGFLSSLVPALLDDSESRATLLQTLARNAEPVLGPLLAEFLQLEAGDPEARAKALAAFLLGDLATVLRDDGPIFEAFAALLDQQGLELRRKPENPT
jgi:hypothetical protein